MSFSSQKFKGNLQFFFTYYSSETPQIHCYQMFLPFMSRMEILKYFTEFFRNSQEKKQ